MAAPLKKDTQQDSKNVSDLFSNTTTTKSIEKTHTPELVIALCGPIGSPLHEVSSSIEAMLKENFGYTTCTQIRLSQLISEYASKVDITIAESGFKKIQSQIEAGLQLRNKFGGGVLAELAVNKISLDRQAYKVQEENEIHVPRRVCHIIDSIKNQEELDLLKIVYREMLYVVGVFSPLEKRQEYLENKGLSTTEIYSLIDRDSGEESENGQTVRNTFPQCDFFLRMDSGTDSQVSKRVERFLNLIFGTKIITPTINESAMYAAASAASSSACLSRQVGAAIMSKSGEIISTGWNDVPRYGGGLYLSESSDPNNDNDKRCWNKDGGKCFNDVEKSLFADHLMDVLGNLIPDASKVQAKETIRSSNKLRGLIEFSRSIHAEMHAILNAVNVAGEKLTGAKLFVTTYPCHSCARHIIAAGISEVYFIEPYRKSLAIKLHGDAITERESELDKVKLLPFDGVAPGRYMDLFKVKPDSRKSKEGIMIKISSKEASPKLEKSMQAFTQLEGLVVKSLVEQNLIAIEGNQDGYTEPTAA